VQEGKEIVIKPWSELRTTRERRAKRKGQREKDSRQLAACSKSQTTDYGITDNEGTKG
jgi:hypothetical protein